MKHSTKVVASKYLLAATSLLPAVGVARAQSNSSPLDFVLRAGFVYMLPNLSSDARIGKKEKIGFNGGAFVEFGGARWDRLPHSGVEFHMEPVGRIDFLMYNTCIYGINADYSIANAESKSYLPKPTDAYPYERVGDFVGTANLNLGLGYRSCLFEVSAGLGAHVDTKRQVDAVMCLGAGLNILVSDRFKIRAGYRARVNFFGNGTLKTSNAGVFHHNVECGLAYFLFVKRRGYYRPAYMYNRYR